MLVDKESQRNLANFTQAVQVTETLDSIALYSNKGTNNLGSQFKPTGNYTQKKSQVQCEYCHFKGHTKENCYKLITYPPDFKSKRKWASPSIYSNHVSGIGYLIVEGYNTTSCCQQQGVHQQCRVEANLS